MYGTRSARYTSKASLLVLTLHLPMKYTLVLILRACICIQLPCHANPYAAGAHMSFSCPSLCGSSIEAQQCTCTMQTSMLRITSCFTTASVVLEKPSFIHGKRIDQHQELQQSSATHHANTHFCNAMKPVLDLCSHVYL